MRVIISEFVSVDGVVQAPGGPQEDTDGGFAHGGWIASCFDPEVMGDASNEVMARTDAMLFGRRTYESAALAWPEMTGDFYGDRINEIPKYVASRTLTEADLSWNNSRLLPADDAIGAVRALRDTEGGGLQVYGSADLVRQLIENDLVDEYRLMLAPVVLGGGKQPFALDGVRRPLRLVSTAQASTGVLVVVYEAVRD